MFRDVLGDGALVGIAIESLAASMQYSATFANPYSIQCPVQSIQCIQKGFRLGLPAISP